MKKYQTNQKAKEKKVEVIGSDIACDEKGCKGEMMIEQPEQKHPELELSRAHCGKCGWRGWV